MMMGPLFAFDLDQFQRMIESLPESVALLDTKGVIIANNHAWRGNIARMGLDHLDVGGNYRDICVEYAGTNADSAAIAAGIDDVAAGRRERFNHRYFGTDLTHGHDFEVCLSAIELAGRRCLVLTNYDVTSERRLREQCRRLESDLLRVGSEERQRLGRDLHDSTAQELVALRLSLIRLKQLQPDPSTLAVLSDIETTLDHMNHEIRAISYLLHPPSLQASSLIEALETMVRGFARRIDLDLTFRFEGNPDHWDPVVEAALYRMAQEALANVQRHAHASQARMRLLARKSGYLHLIVEDNGVGIRLSPQREPILPGVGILGMQARIRELGGRFAIRRCDYGTRLAASLKALPDEARKQREALRLAERARDRNLLAQVTERLQAAIAPALAPADGVLSLVDAPNGTRRLPE